MKEHGVPESRLTVIEEVEPYISPGGSKQIQYLCQCECGNTCILNGNRVRNGYTLSCGCLQKEKLIERNLNNSTVKVGDRYGKLTVIKDLGLRKQPSRNKRERWSLCQCDCGSPPIEVKNNMLQNGWKKSCGCLESYGELTIENILKENNINFSKEYSFPDLYVKGPNHLLRFDFAIFNDDKLSYLIEFDGRQHYTGPEAQWKRSRTLEEIQEYDRLKNEYCEKNNIPLIRIPYTRLSKLSFSDLDISTSDFVIKNKIKECKGEL